MSITPTPKIRGFIADFIRAAAVVVAVLVVLINAAPSLHISAQYVAYAAAAVGAINALVGLLKPYAASAVKSIFRGGR